MTGFPFIDSLVIIFDDSKVRIYASQELATDTTRNLLFNEAYMVNDNKLYRYVFTEEDYNNAEVIEE